MTLDAQVLQDADFEATLDLVRFLEASGFNGAWLIDSPPMGAPDVYAMLALASRQTTRLRLATGVTNPVTRHASVTANAILTIDRLSGGRAELGIGLGYTAVRAIGLPPARIQALRDYIAAVRQTFAERGASIPVYVASSGPKALMAAGQVGDGALVSTGTHPALIRNALSYIRRGAEEAGRDIGQIDVVFQAGLAIGNDTEEACREAGPMAARKALDVLRYPDTFLPPELDALRADSLRVAREYDVHRHTDPDAPVNRLVTDAMVDAFTLAGTAERCAEKVRAMEAAGARRILLTPWGRRRREALERFVERVRPRLGPAVQSHA